MATVFPITPGLNETWGKGKTALEELLANLFDPNRQTSPPGMMGNKAPMGVGGLMANAVMPGVKEAIEGGAMGLSPGYIAANYRTPQAIQGLRKAMAAENRARGPLGRKLINPEMDKDLLAYSSPKEYADARLAKNPRADYQMAIDQYDWLNPTDPVDQILRGSWFHGMRPEARQQVFANTGDQLLGDLAGQESFSRFMNAPSAGDEALYAANFVGFPGSTHANPSYTRFGEPYGVSVTASPSVAASGFSPDQMIHRVQPLYGGPPTESIIPMWRPEGVKAMNEGYNTAFNQMLGQGVTIADLNKMQHLGIPTGYIQPGEPFLKALKGPFETASFMNQPLEAKVAKLGESMASSQPITSEFNTLYSQALQAQGKRGILYSPQRYGEYEMLMLDPSFVRPLDYRKVGDYLGEDTFNRLAKHNINFPESGPITLPPNMTPGAAQGYISSQPEFETGTTRLGDVFNQVPWVDRINEENKKRIAELIDPQYREAVLNQLFR